MSTSFSLEEYEIQVETVHRNLTPARLYEEALRNESGSQLTSTGALATLSGKKTGRSPKDKRVVDNPESYAQNQCSRSSQERWFPPGNRFPGR